MKSFVLVLMGVLWLSPRFSLGAQGLVKTLRPVGKSVLRDEAVTAVAVSSDGSLLASETLKGIVRIWSLASNKLVKSFKIPSGSRLRFSKNGQKLIAMGSFKVMVFDIAKGKVISAREGHPTVFDISADGKRVITNVPFTNVLELWDAETGEVLSTYYGRGDHFLAVAFLSETQVVTTQSMPSDPEAKDNERRKKKVAVVTGKIWDLETREVFHEYTFQQGTSSSFFQSKMNSLRGQGWDHWIYIVAKSADSSRIAFRSHAFSHIDIRNLLTGELIYTAPIGMLAAISSDGRWVATAAENQITVADLKKEEFLASLDLTSYGVHLKSLALSPQGRFLFAGCSDGTVKIFQLFD